MNQFEIIFSSASANTTDEEIVQAWEEAMDDFTNYLDGTSTF